MASFNQDPQPTNDPSYLGLAQATDKPLATPVPPTAPISSIFENLNKIVPAAVKGVDDLMKDALKDRLRTGIESIQDSTGTGQATDLAAQDVNPTGVAGDSTSTASILSGGSPVVGGKAGRGTPAGVARLGEQLTDLRDSYNSGSMGESLFLGKVNALVKQMSVQFPGYKEDIIDMATHALGGTQEKLRKSILADLDANAKASQSQVSKQDAFVLSKIDEFEGTVGSQLYQKYKQDGNFNAFVNAYAIQKGGVNALTQARAQLGFLSESSDYNKKIGAQKMGSLFGALVQNDIALKVDATGKSLADLTTQLNEQAKRPMNEKQRLEGAAAADAWLRQEENRLYAEARKIDPNTGKSFAGVHGEAVVREQIQAALSQGKSVLEAFTSDKHGVAGYHAAIAKGIVDQVHAGILQDSPTMAAIEAVRRSAGDPLMSSMFMSDPTTFSPVVKAVTGSFKYRLVADQVDTVAGEIAKVNKPEESGAPQLAEPEKKQVIHQMVQDSVKAINDPLAKPDHIRAAARTMFSDKNMSSFLSDNPQKSAFTPNSQPAVYATVFNTQTTQRLKELNDPAVWNQYQKANVQAFTGMFRQGVQDLQQGAVENSKYEVRINPGNYQYEVTVRPQFKAQQIAQNIAAGRPADAIPPSVAIPMNRVNQALRTFIEVAKADNKDPKKFLPDVLDSMGYHPENAAKPLPDRRTEFGNTPLFTPEGDTFNSLWDRLVGKK